MNKFLYIMLLEKTKLYNKMTKADISKHVENLKQLDDAGKLVLCGPIQGFPVISGMIILKTKNLEEAQNICMTEPFVLAGLVTYQLLPLEAANRENNYLI